jgi:hypothetical protein
VILAARLYKSKFQLILCFYIDLKELKDSAIFARGAGISIIAGADIHIFVFTGCKHNRFQKKLIALRAVGSGSENILLPFCVCKNLITEIKISLI